jgi:23S rRNA (guanine745-N1)-methyltransferase
VRGCGLLLERRGRTYTCARRHAYDLARSGYLSVLQPNDRRSPTPGDSREAVVARGRLLARGIGASILARVADRAVDGGTEDSVIADLGSGGGEALSLMFDRVRVTGIGIDLSVAAAEQAARRYPHLLWVVANADRRLPLLDRSVDVIVSLHGRRNPEEAARVLATGGRLVVAFPAADDLQELRAHLHGEATDRQRADAVVAEHESHFALSHREIVQERHQVDGDILHDLLRGTYRGARTSELPRLASLPSSLEVTVSTEIVEFTSRPRALKADSAEAESADS